VRAPNAATAHERHGGPSFTTARRRDLEVLWSYLSGAADDHPSDVLFCFGSRNLGVARRAAALFGRSVAPWVLVSGGAVDGIEPHATEADAFAHVLRERGVPPERIVPEHRAANTGENVRFGMRALTERGIEVRFATLVAWPTSQRRCVATFSRQFPRVVTYTQPSFDGLRQYGSAPSRAVEICLAELERLRAYPSRGYITAPPIPAAVDLAAERLSAFMRLELPEDDDESEQLAG
jgi:DUF218 domain